MRIIAIQSFPLLWVDWISVVNRNWLKMRWVDENYFFKIENMEKGTKIILKFHELFGQNSTQFWSSENVNSKLELAVYSMKTIGFDGIKWLYLFYSATTTNCYAHNARLMIRIFSDFSKFSFGWPSSEPRVHICLGIRRPGWYFDKINSNKLWTAFRLKQKMLPMLLSSFHWPVL